MSNIERFMSESGLNASDIAKLMVKAEKTEEDEEIIRTHDAALAADIEAVRAARKSSIDACSEAAENARQAKEERLRSFLMKCKGGGE